MLASAGRVGRAGQQGVDLGLGEVADVEQGDRHEAAEGGLLGEALDDRPGDVGDRSAFEPRCREPPGAGRVGLSVEQAGLGRRVREHDRRQADGERAAAVGAWPAGRSARSATSGRPVVGLMLPSDEVEVGDVGDGRPPPSPSGDQQLAAVEPSRSPMVAAVGEERPGRAVVERAEDAPLARRRRASGGVAGRSGLAGSSGMTYRQSTAIEVRLLARTLRAVGSMGRLLKIDAVMRRGCR